MLATVYLLVTSLAGFAVVTKRFPTAPAIVRIPAGFLLAVVFTSWITYLIADALSGQTDHSLKIGIIISTLLGAGVLAWLGRSLRPRDLKMPLVDASVGVFSLAISSWLMHAHLRTEEGQLMVSSNTWGDMGLHIALSRSFSVGGNYPTEYPFFANEPIRYHFGFDFFAGMLQEGGLSVLRSFNLPGVLGFTAMIVLTFATARLLFGPAEERLRWFRDKGVWAGLVAVLLLVTNQSLGWLRYLDHDGKGSIGTALSPSVLWDHKDYLTGGPYTNDRITMFNTLNPYLTQMHLIVAIAVVLLLVYALIWQLRSEDGPDRRVLIALGITFGFSFWLNGVVWLAAAVFMGMLLVIWGLSAVWQARKDGTTSPRVTWIGLVACFVVPALLLGVPQALMLNGGGTGNGLSVHLSYLVCNSTNSSCHDRGHMNLLSLADYWTFIEYWWLNEGLFIPLLVVAFFLGNGRDKKIIGAVTFVFIWGSLFYVGADIGGQNHKVFNLWENLGGPFAAFAVVELWIVAGRLLRGGAGRRAVGVVSRAAVVCGVVFLTMTGLIDFATVKNDFRVSVFGEEPQQQTMNWIVKNTPPRSSFVTDYDQLYTAPTLAGRRVALGYTSWVSSAGYDSDARAEEIKAIYTAPDQATLCQRLLASRFDYVLVGPQERDSPRFDLNDYLFAQLRPIKIISTAEQQHLIYKVSDNC